MQNFVDILTVILLIRSKEDSHTIFRDAAALNMTESGYIWIVTEQALNANNTPDGVIGLQLVHAKSENNHIRVSMCKCYKRHITSSYDFHFCRKLIFRFQQNPPSFGIKFNLRL